VDENAEGQADLVEKGLGFGDSGEGAPDGVWVAVDVGVEFVRELRPDWFF